MKSAVVLVQIFLFLSGVTQAVVPILTRNLTRTERQTNNGVSCVLPPHPGNGKWTLINGEGKPGAKISKNSILKYECNSGYKLSSTSQYVVCEETWDISKMPVCEKLCPPIFSTPTMIVKCVDKNGASIPCSEATEGSYLSYSCIPYYEAPQGFKQNLLCLVGGMWNYPKPICQPVCGKKIEDEALPLIYGGDVAKSIEYPWVAAIYRKQESGYLNICGASIISRKVFLTAAHCVTNDYGDTLPSEKYLVGAGKIYNKFDDRRDTKAQYLEISRIIVNSEYKGDSRNFLADIAVLVTKKLFVLNSMIQPVCYGDLRNVHIHAGNTGEIAGWGVTEDGRPSEILRSLKIPYKHKDTCAKELPQEWADKYNAFDKICAGFLGKNISVCRGDSGGGLTFKNPEDNRYYIHGIVSIGPSLQGQCNIQQNSLYTSVAFYYEFVDREANANYVEECMLPPYPPNGRWKIEDDPGKAPGNIVNSNTVLNVSCNDGFTLSSSNSLTDCESSLMNMPTCQKICSPLNLPNGTKLQCKDKRGQDIPCALATNGSRLWYTCPEGYRQPDGAKRVQECLNGSWEPQVECQPSDFKVICTYASWAAAVSAYPEYFNASLCTHVNYAFIGIWSHGNLRVQDEATELDGGNKGLYRRVTDMKKENKNLKVLLSVGGSGASNASIYSSTAADPVKRMAFIRSALYFIITYNFDGLDIEWFYPTENDKDNYITLLRELKKAFKEQGLLLSATVHPKLDSTGYDGKQMNEILDWVIVKTYDLYGGTWSSHTGIHSPLYPSRTQNNWERTRLSMQASANNWLKTGIDKSKLVLSIAFYGRSFTLKDKQQHGLNSPVTGPGPGIDVGVVLYSEICTKYANWTTVWDDEQIAVYKYHENEWFGYDNKDSVWIKTAYIKENGFAGVNVWSVNGDDVHGKCGTKQILLKHVHGGLGHQVNWAN